MKKEQHEKYGRLSRDVLFNYNRLWQQLYYDHLYEYQDYQISICSADPTGYYNAVHGAYENTQELEKNIAYIEAKHQVSLGVFSSHDDLAGWKRRPSDDENWWEFDLANIGDQKYEADKLRVSLFSRDNADVLEAFLEIDRIANNLSKDIVSTLRRNISTRRNYESFGLVGSQGDEPCACGYWGFVDDVAYLAEGGVLPKFRNRGFHKAITQLRLTESAKRASKAIMVCAVESDSNKTAKSLGFRLLTKRNFFVRDNL